MHIKCESHLFDDAQKYLDALQADNERGDVFEFWHVDALMTVVEEILASAKESGWEPPKPEEHTCPECGTKGPGFHNVELCTDCNPPDEEG